MITWRSLNLDKLNNWTVALVSFIISAGKESIFRKNGSDTYGVCFKLCEHLKLTPALVLMFSVWNMFKWG